MHLQVHGGHAHVFANFFFSTSTWWARTWFCHPFLFNFSIFHAASEKVNWSGKGSLRCNRICWRWAQTHHHRGNSKNIALGQALGVLFYQTLAQCPGECCCCRAHLLSNVIIKNYYICSIRNCTLYLIRSFIKVMPRFCTCRQ